MNFADSLIGRSLFTVPEKLNGAFDEMRFIEREGAVCRRGFVLRLTPKYEIRRVAFTRH